MSRTLLKAQLVRHEGLRLKAYTDTEGHLTIGVGHNLENGISEAAARFILDEDIFEAELQLRQSVPIFGGLDEVRRQVLVNMCFNLGITRLLGFRRMLAAVNRLDFNTAATEMLDSKWARQVGDRAVELSIMMKEGA